MLKIIIINIMFITSINADVKHFNNINEAVSTFIKALQERDADVLEELFTSKYKEIVHIKVIDRDDVERFLDAYTKSNKLANYGSNTVYIAVGKNDWTFPVPLVNEKNSWSFDINQGLENMITREIGRNELALIEAFEDAMTYEELLKSDLATVYIFQKDEERIVAIPREYNKTALMCFTLSKNGTIHEADLMQKMYSFDKRFNEVDAYYLKNK